MVLSLSQKESCKTFVMEEVSEVQPSVEPKGMSSKTTSAQVGSQVDIML
jgi:hypothetical protein